MSTLSSYPNLEQCRKQAKDLRKAHAGGSEEAARRARAYLQRFAESTLEEILAADLALRDAQHVVAREHGYDAWQGLLDAVAPRTPAPPRERVVESADYTDDDLLPVQLLRIERVEGEGGGAVVLVVLIDADERILTISIGETEGIALASQVRGESFPRPLSHDLLSTFVGLLKGTVDAVVIHSLQETTFLAHVVVELDGARRYVDARPSDGLNLAARQQAPIYATRELMASAGRPLSALPNQLGSAARTPPTKPPTASPA